MIAPDDPQLRRIGEPGERGLILYDGDCVLCSNWFRFVAQRDAEGKFLFTAIQSPYGRALAVRHGIDPNNPQSNAVLLDGNVNLRSDFGDRCDLSFAGLWLGARVSRHPEISARRRLFDDRAQPLQLVRQERDLLARRREIFQPGNRLKSAQRRPTTDQGASSGFSTCAMRSDDVEGGSTPTNLPSRSIR